MELQPLLLLFGFLAGAVDAIAGGGGLIQLPALFILQPQLPLGAILGCNKLSSFSGTTYALFHYNKKLDIRWHYLYGGIATAFLGSFIGARAALLLNKDAFTPYIIIALFVVFIYSFFNSEAHAAKIQSHTRPYIMAIFCFAIGFYDGCIGPGTGSFLIAGLLLLLPFTFIEASAHSKVINLSTNMAALALFISMGAIAWSVAIPLAVSNVAGSIVGSRWAVKKGNRWVRIVFRIVTAGLLCKMIYNYSRVF